jgi:hypothetical protein
VHSFKDHRGQKTKAQTMTGGGEALNRAGRCQLQYTTRLVAATL